MVSICFKDSLQNTQRFSFSPIMTDGLSQAYSELFTLRCLLRLWA
jgi:hypothetical protein